MRSRSIRVEKVGSAKGERPAFLVIRARGSRWCRWLNDSAVPDYDALAQAEIAAGWWDNLDDWLEVGPNDCLVCGHPQPLCSFCRAQAIYFLEWDDLVAWVALCSDCGEPYVKINEIHEQFREEIGWPEMEVVLYACCDGCVCDHWH
jgi:hypothetical protein